MNENAELTGLNASNGKKRKPRDEQLEMPSPKQVRLDCRDSNTEVKKIETDGFNESEPESTNSNSFFHSNSDDSFMSNEPSTSSASWASSLYSSSINSSSSEPESSSIEFGRNPDLGLLECGDEIKNCTDELDDLLKGVAQSSSFVLSSGRWSVKRDAQSEGKKKLTIDKEFEQYFSMLML